jgi:hypothetical protein
MNGWEFFNNCLFGFIIGLTMGFVKSPNCTDTDQPAYVTAWHVGVVAGCATTISLMAYLFKTGALQ